jgi:hypothetical protein
MNVMSSQYEDAAARFAYNAAGQTAPEKLTNTIGEGLAAVALALLDVADALRDVAQAQKS